MSEQKSNLPPNAEKHFAVLAPDNAILAGPLPSRDQALAALASLEGSTAIGARVEEVRVATAKDLLSIAREGELEAKEILEGPIAEFLRSSLEKISETLLEARGAVPLASHLPEDGIEFPDERLLEGILSLLRSNENFQVLYIEQEPRHVKVIRGNPTDSILGLLRALEVPESEIEERAGEIAEAAKACLLCGEPSATLGSTPREGRVDFYGLCPGCTALSDLGERVSGALAKRGASASVDLPTPTFN